MNEKETAAALAAYRTAQEGAVLEIADQGLLTLSSLVDSGAIDVAPSFQRRDRWDATRQSLLIESFLTNIPVPPVYLAEDLARMGSYAVIDGKQRLTSISIFFRDELALRGLTRLPILVGQRYSDLPEGIRNSLGMKSLRVTTLLRQSEEELKHEVFLRLNTGGEILNPQEIRNVAYRGPLNDLVYTLANDPFLRKQFKVQPPNSPAYRQMTDAEYVLRFLMLSDGWKSFRGDLRVELDDFMAKNRFAEGAVRVRLQRSFERAITAAHGIWGDHAFKRPGRDQALAGLFDAQMIALAELSDPEVKTLVGRRARVIRVTDALFDDPDFDENVRRATNTPQRLRDRTNSTIATLRSALQ
jgi:hypothetical protein